MKRQAGGIGRGKRSRRRSRRPIFAKRSFNRAKNLGKAGEPAELQQLVNYDLIKGVGGGGGGAPKLTQQIIGPTGALGSK